MSNNFPVSTVLLPADFITMLRTMDLGKAVAT